MLIADGPFPIPGVLRKDERGLYMDQPAGMNPETRKAEPGKQHRIVPSRVVAFTIFVRDAQPTSTIIQ
jgi:hypothetical protein